MFSSLKPPNLVEGIDAWQCAVLANYIFFYFLVKLLISAEKLKGIKNIPGLGATIEPVIQPRDFR